MNWGIYSASGISNKYIDALQAEGETVYAIASRSAERAWEYKNKYSIIKEYSNYDDLINDKNIDIVYVSNVNSHHCNAVISCIEAGKHVVCEKPMAISAEEARQMTQCAKRNNKFLMEAMWTRAQPIFKDIRKLVSDGVIGEVTRVWADFSFVSARDPERRLLNYELGGGAIYDIGIYSLMLILDFLGLDVKNVRASGFIGDTGVDEDATVLINYGNGKMGIMTNSFISPRPQMAVITGTEGMIKIPGFIGADRSEVIFFKNNENAGYELNSPCVENKFRYQVRHAVECVRNGKLESDLIPWSHSVKAAEIIDKALLDIRGEKDV